MPEEPFVDGRQESPVETVIIPSTRDLGGFEVRRALPSRRRRMVGPFIFFDQMGPTVFRSGEGLDVRPHPHIGLATVTYLFAGEILHRDSLGTVQSIRPGAVNWMTAGGGIVHSERTPGELRAGGGALYGIQTWVALPKRFEEVAPRFVHTPEEDLPIIQGDGVRVRLIVGALYGARSPVQVMSETLYADVQLGSGVRFVIPADYEERAAFVAEGALEVAGATYDAGQLVVLRPGGAVDVRAVRESRVLLLGGEPADGPRHIWWNFVSSSRERIEAAAADWAAGRFARIPGETEFIPLPEGARIARYP